MKIQKIREKMKQNDIDAYVIAHGNRFIGQDILQSEHKLKTLCGFSGSAGIAVVTADKAFLLVDGRYELQARFETNADEITVVDENPRFKSVCDLLMQKNIKRIGYDAWNHSVAEMEFLKRRYRDLIFIDIGDWVETESNRSIEAKVRDVRFAGVSREEKCKMVTAEIAQQNADYMLLTSADSVSWLLNIYARDLPCSPIVRAYASVAKNGEITLFSNNLQADLPVKSWADFATFLQTAADKKILYDARTAPEKIKQTANSAAVLLKVPDMCAMQKAEKNPTELQGMINCHIRDGAAVVRFLVWLDDNWRGKTELDAVEKLHQFRAEQAYFFSESFETIVGSGANGAVVHYQPTEASNTELKANSLLLVDSGGQYFDGTTDITRTIVIGEPTKEMIADFTAVLKAHIALTRVRFPEGTGGIKLDTMARAELWRIGADYKHGTGHGVACFGNVHEGPISISSNGSDYGFKANMVTSNEPGIYKEGKYGIRIENLQYTASVAGAEGFLEFRYLTKVPIDKKLIDKYLLSGDEIAWLNKYHCDVYESLAPYLNDDEKIWLKDACSPL
ncbi:MAG: aminopeptidase P family protein [Alphaproteobacteria bacterium]|nr:aminopeptidase P family protein [Alphaproteobacteria bacterium]